MSAHAQPLLTPEQVRRLAELYASHSDLMLRIAARALPASGSVSADDVVQTVFLEAVAASSDRPWVHIGAGWLIQRLRARILDQHRRAGRQQRLLAAVASVEHPSSAEDVALDGAAVQELLAAVPDPYDRLTLALRLSGYREAEVARLLSIPYERRQVRDRMRRVRAQVDALRSGARGPESRASGRT